MRHHISKWATTSPNEPPHLQMSHHILSVNDHVSNSEKMYRQICSLSVVFYVRRSDRKVQIRPGSGLQHCQHLY
jgi:hypothetical protein